MLYLGDSAHDCPDWNDFQLITWSKDKTIRVWPVQPDAMQVSPFVLFASTFHFVDIEVSRNVASWTTIRFICTTAFTRLRGQQSFVPHTARKY